LSREGSLSCHTCCDTGPRFFRSHPKDRPIQSPLTAHMGMWRIYSNPDPHRDQTKIESAYRDLHPSIRQCSGYTFVNTRHAAPQWCCWRKKSLSKYRYY
jgi:hypothetical protein